MPPTQDMEMNVKNRLPGMRARIRHDTITRLGNTLLPCNLHARINHLSEQVGIGAREIRHRWDMPAGNNKYMDGSLGVDVFKSDDLIILVDEV